MSDAKEAEAAKDAISRDDAPPAYDQSASTALSEAPSSSSAVVATAPQTRDQDFPDQEVSDAKSHAAASRSTTHGTDAGPSNSSSEPVPTVESPFNFPSQAPLPPAYTEALDDIAARPIAIPQISSLPTSPFLSAYPPLLLSYGITSSSFVAFLSTVSAFLTAKVSDRAISHAGDMAKSIAEQPTNSFKSVFKHAKTVGKDIGKNAKKGNVIGAAMGVVGGTVTIPLFAVGGLVASAASLPGMTIAAVVKKPKTPRQRAAAYIAVANDKWFAARGLYAVLLDSQELAQVLRVPVPSITEDAARKDASIEGQLRSLEAHVERLQLQDPTAKLDLGKKTMWLVLSKAVIEENAVQG